MILKQEQSEVKATDELFTTSTSKEERQEVRHVGRTMRTMRKSIFSVIDHLDDPVCTTDKHPNTGEIFLVNHVFKSRYSTLISDLYTKFELFKKAFHYFCKLLTIEMILFHNFCLKKNLILQFLPYRILFLCV